MNQIEEQEFRDAIIATKKDAKLVAAAKNERTNSASGMYAEFTKLPVERRRDILVLICNDHFVASQWKIAFPMNNFPAAVLPLAVVAVGKALFYARDEDSVRETVRAIKLYEDSPYLRLVSTCLGDAAETTGEKCALVPVILTAPDVFGLIKSLEPSSPASEQIVRVTGKAAMYTRDLESTLAVSKFLHARRYSPNLADLASIVENSIFLARDRCSVQRILDGFTAGSIDVVLQKNNKQIASAIQDAAWKLKDSAAIRKYLQGYL